MRIQESRFHRVWKKEEQNGFTVGYQSGVDTWTPNARYTEELDMS